MYSPNGGDCASDCISFLPSKDRFSYDKLNQFLFSRKYVKFQNAFVYISRSSLLTRRRTSALIILMKRVNLYVVKNCKPKFRLISNCFALLLICQQIRVKIQR